MRHLVYRSFDTVDISCQTYISTCEVLLPATAPLGSWNVNDFVGWLPVQKGGFWPAPRLNDRVTVVKLCDGSATWTAPVRVENITTTPAVVVTLIGAWAGDVVIVNDEEPEDQNTIIAVLVDWS